MSAERLDVVLGVLEELAESHEVFRVSGSCGPLLTTAAGNPITSYTIPATDWTMVSFSRWRANDGTSDFSVEALAPGPAVVGISHPNFITWQGDIATVIP